MNLDTRISRRKFIQSIVMASGAATVDWSGLGALADGFPKKKNFPVVVIGAGLGGLVSAAYLAKYGFNVTVLEQHRMPGGYATSFYRKKRKYCFDVSLHTTVAKDAAPQRILSDLGVWDKLDVVWAPELRRIITPRFDVTLPARNPMGVKSELSKRFPHEEKGIHGFYSEMEAVVGGLKSRSKFVVALMEKLEKISLSQWMAMHVSDPDVVQCMAVFSGYYGLGPSRINALFYAIATGEYLVHGGQYYQTRSQALSDTLAKAVADYGGKLQMRTQVDKILFDNNNAIQAVRDTDGNIYPAKAVIANCSVPALVNTMLPATVVPADYREKIHKRTNSLSSFVVWLGLKGSVAHRVPEYEISILGDNPDLEKRPSSLKELGNSGLSVTIYDNLYSGYSQPGTTTMSIMCLSDFTPWKQFESDYFKGVKRDYRKEKQRIAAQLIRRVEEKLVPGLKGMIEVQEVGTPLTNMRYTGNTDGAIYGFTLDGEQRKVRTPVKGLYLASAWSHGGGYTPAMMAGRQAAQTMLGNNGG